MSVETGLAPSPGRQDLRRRLVTAIVLGPLFLLAVAVGRLVFLGAIMPGLSEPDPALPESQRLSRAVEENVLWTVRQIIHSPEGQAAMAEGRTKVLGAVYEIGTGRVRML